MGKVILYIAQSLDGYIARENGEIDWLWDDTDEDYGYERLYESVGTVFLGRKTYERILESADEFPYKKKDIYIVSNAKEGNDQHGTYIQPEQVKPLVNILKGEQNQNIWVVGGAQLIHEFIELKLIDEYQLVIQPTLIGKGIPLFQHSSQEEDLSLTHVQPYPDGMLLLTYTRREIVS
ncbi:dihydrofolate reductase family protein [Halobacillus litoralis]|uniref:dihydrofolate reductase family protein n=1 Tax=Halobacillus litoralis TaxID=45668 RepID=UPI001CFC9898|nr:dihydrofolate reductase family protein [Halobacillus litoralis]